MNGETKENHEAGERRDPFPPMNVQLYAAYMEEIKHRSEAITKSIKVIKDGTDGPLSYMHAEFGYLQLRYICELVALSSLAAHHDLGLGTRLLKEWNAGQVFALLEQINPHCFPTSIRNIPDNRGVHNFHVVEGPSDLKRSDLSKMYAGCGAVLHRGMIKDVMAGKPREYRLEDLNSWHSQLMGLLTQHMILLRNPDRTLLVNFYSDDGKVAVYSAEAVEPEDLAPEIRAALDGDPAG